VILNGDSTVGVASTRTITNQLQAATSAVTLFVYTDQEGGEVPRRRGYAFSAIPAAVTQGRIRHTDDLTPA
jgi:beta-glucosidase-like glycosyl hydrolase